MFNSNACTCIYPNSLSLRAMRLQKLSAFEFDLSGSLKADLVFQLDFSIPIGV